MKLYITILLTILSLVFLSYDAFAGTTMQTISKTTTILNFDEEKRKADEALRRIKERMERSSSSVYISNSLDRWHLKNLKKYLHDYSQTEKELLILEAIRNLYRQKSQFVATVFPDETLGTFLSDKTNNEVTYDEYVSEAQKYHLEIFDRESLGIESDYDIVDMRNAIATHDRDQLKLIVKIIHESLKASEDALTPTDIAGIRKHVILGQVDQARAIVDKALKVYASSAVGAHVFVGSEIIE